LFLYYEKDDGLFLYYKDVYGLFLYKPQSSLWYRNTP
jgi:hypothetical protein